MAGKAKDWRSEMSRHFWTKMIHEEAREGIQLLNDEEAGRWFRGWIIGASGAHDQEKIDRFPKEMREGYESGRRSHFEGQKRSEDQRAKATARWEKEQGGCRNDAAAYPAGDAGAYAEPYAENMPATATVTTTKREKKEAPSAPSRSEWDAHAKEAFPWWPRWDVDKAFDYWSGRGFTRNGKRIRSDWRRLMGTWAGKWADEHREEVARYSEPVIQENGNRLPSGFRPLGKAPEV